MKLDDLFISNDRNITEASLVAKVPTFHHYTNLQICKDYTKNLNLCAKAEQQVNILKNIDKSTGQDPHDSFIQKTDQNNTKGHIIRYLVNFILFTGI